MRGRWLTFPVRYLVLFVLLFASCVSYGDRTVLGIAGPALAASLGLNAVEMGYLLSAASLPYLLMKLPSGILLDRFGSRWIYCAAMALLSLCTLAQGLSALLPGAVATALLFSMRFLSGAFSSPIFPANARITANWFPAAERGLASAIFNTAQYFALIIFAPLSAWAVHAFSWPVAFYILAVLGLIVAAIFPALVTSPLRHPLVGPAELAHIEQGGGLIHIETNPRPSLSGSAFFGHVAFRRPLMGLYLFQYCIGVLTTFFMTWFPIYLVQHSGMSILGAGIGTAVPAAFGLAGGIAGGLISDATLRRTGSLTVARGVPIVIGFSIALAMVAANFTNAPLLVIGLMSMAFFGKGVAALGWTMISDIAPENLIGTTGGIFSTISGLSGVLTPVIMGYIVSATGAFDWAIVYVAAHCFIGMAAFALIIRRIERIEV
jgi:ACS family glucarate transporter-like MFS transporter